MGAVWDILILFLNQIYAIKRHANRRCNLYYIIFRYKVINVILTSYFYFISSKPHLTSHIYDVTCPMSQVSPFTDDPPFTNFSKYACLQWIVNKLWMVKVSKRSFASLIEHIANTLLYYTWGSHYIRSLI